MQRYHANNKVATLTKCIFGHHPGTISNSMQNLSGGQNFPFGMTRRYQICICPKIRPESRPKIAKSILLSSSTFDKDIGRQEYPFQFVEAISVQCSNSSPVFLIMWRLFNNPNQEPIILSIFGVVLNTQSARSSSFVCWFFGVGPRPADLLPKAEATGGKWSNESKIENHMSIFYFQFVSYWLKFKWTKTTWKVKVPLQFSCSMIKFSFICDYYNLCFFGAEIRSNEISPPLK